MKIRKILLLLVIWGLVGCAKNPISYEEALLRFSVGMTPDQVRQSLGKPVDISDEGGSAYWTYVPEKKIQKGPLGNYSGFTVVFSQGKASELLKHEIVKH